MRSLRARLASTRVVIAVLAVLLFNSVYLAYSNRLPGPPRDLFIAFFYEGNVLLHLLFGWAILVVVVRLARAWRAAIASTAGAGKLLGGLSLLSTIICLAAGIGLLIWGNLHPMDPVLKAHGIGAVVALLAGVLWLMARSAQHRETLPAVERRFTKAAAGLAAAALAPAVVLLWLASQRVAEEAKINNPSAIPTSMVEEGDGPSGKFWPSSNQTVNSKFFPPEYFTDNKSCGEPGCHPDIYKQWLSSAHRNSSFNNQWYRKSIEYMQEVVGTKASKWCGGCHDMAVLLTEKPGTGKSRFDYPIKDQIWPVEDHPESHAGISCSACHSMVHIKSTMGQGDYLADYPPMHQFVVSKNPLMRFATKFLTRLAPDPHRKTFLKPFHTMNTAKFCSTCHKVHLDVAVNNYRWFRGFNDYDAWQASGVSGFGARSFYYPKDEKGNPAFKKCADCHMPLTKSDDAGNISGQVHSHAFPAANTAIPWANHDTKQLELVQKFLKDGALSIDIFALRRPKAGTENPNPKSQNPKSPTEAPEGHAASLMGDAATTGNANLIGASGPKVSETVIAPLNRGPVAVKRGEDALIDVVVRTKKIGHAFPGGTFDAFDVWVELQAKDETGKTLFWSGKLDFPGGPVEAGAHQYRALLVDAHANAINKRNAWAARARIYARAIPPGAADTIHYRLHIPKDCGNKITLTAKLNYRKFSWWNTQFAFGGRPEDPKNPAYSSKGFIEGVAVGYEQSGTPKSQGPVSHAWDDRPMKFDGALNVVAAKEKKIPDLPITALCENTVTLDVTNGDPVAATAPRKLDPEKDRERWNDYGIGLMLQGDFQRATAAFKKVGEVAPKWPEGYVNIGRVRLQEGDLTESQSMFEKALKMYDANPTPMSKYQKARTQFFYGLALKGWGRYDDALRVWGEAMQVFPDDRELRNQMGRVNFLSKRFDQAIAHFNHVLTIDPEDLTANYNLMLCYRGANDPKKAEYHQKLYLRFKADETTTFIAGPYLRSNPEDNNESLTIHEHGDAAPPRKQYLPRQPEVVKKQAPGGSKRTISRSMAPSRS
jgi:tetratricopeptide (TPR) repeat protein